MGSQRILVTGTNSGFGLLMVRTLASKGHTVFAAMRGVDGKNKGAATELRAWADANKAKVTILEADVTSTDSVEKAVKQALESGPLDVVVNNAGVATVGHNETVTPEQLAQLFDVNVVGPQRVCRAVLPSMRSAKKGLLIHISSELARIPLPFMGAYSASKAALDALAETYRYELAGVGVESVIVQPGAFPTEFGQKGMFGQDASRAQGYGPTADGPQQMFKSLGEMMTGPNAPKPQIVADAVAALVEMPAGKRPLRTTVDPTPMKQGVDVINSTADGVIRQTLSAWGMGPMLG